MPIASTALLAGAGLGAAKHFGVDAPKAGRQKKLRAATARYSPWTGLNPQNVQVDQPNILGGMIGGAGTVASLGQSGLLGQGLKNQLSPYGAWDKMGGQKGFGGSGQKFGSGVQSLGRGNYADPRIFAGGY